MPRWRLASPDRVAAIDDGVLAEWHDYANAVRRATVRGLRLQACYRPGAQPYHVCNGVFVARVLRLLAADGGPDTPRLAHHADEVEYCAAVLAAAYHNRTPQRQTGTAAARHTPPDEMER